MNLTLSNDLFVADGLETVTLRRRRDNPAAPGTDISHALRRAVTTREAAASGGRSTASDVVWHLPVRELSQPPGPGDLLCDTSGRRWTVLEVARTTLNTRWRCRTRSKVVTYALDQTVTILASTTQGEGESLEVIWRPWKIGIPARIEPVPLDPGQTPPAPARYQIFIEEDLVLDQTHRIQGPGGTLYNVLRTTAPPRIGELAVVDVELAP